MVAVAGAVLVLVFALTVAAGQRGGDEFFDNLWLALLGLGAYGAAVVAFLLGAVAIATAGERGIAVIATTTVGLAVGAFGVMEVLSSH